ncbi:microtubule-associated protein RP/EB family member 1-like isoform X2 [Eriocheir sinensis]|nr:microtubule-associated protein RP/EB family member 1-like isoform X2 [Eriocheir sinensis]
MLCPLVQHGNELRPAPFIICPFWAPSRTRELTVLASGQVAKMDSCDIKIKVKINGSKQSDAAESVTPPTPTQCPHASTPIQCPHAHPVPPRLHAHPVQSEGSSYLNDLSQVSATVVNLLLQTQEQSESELQDAHDQISDAHRQISAYMAQLEDAHRELEVYKDQLQRASSQIEEMRERGREEERDEEEEEEEEERRRKEATLKEEQLEGKIRARIEEERERIKASYVERERSAVEQVERAVRER